MDKKGCLFRRKKKNGELCAIWQMKYRVWDSRSDKWGRYKYESTGTRNERKAAAQLTQRVEREERRRLGLEPAESEIRMETAVTKYLDETHVFDREWPTRNRKGVHPVLEREVQGTPWWIRRLDFANDALRHFGDRIVAELAQPGCMQAFDKWLTTDGGRQAKGVGQSTRHKVHTWFRTFCNWCRVRGYMRLDPYDLGDGFQIPPEQVTRQDAIVPVEDAEVFWTAYRKLGLKARVRVGLVLFTGARRGETETIRVSDVSPRFRTVRRQIWKGRNNGTPREKVVQIPQVLIDDIEAWVKKAGLQAAEPLLPMRCDAGRRFLEKWGTSLRGLRRTVLTRLDERGQRLSVIQQVAGHAKLSTTQKYLGVGEQAVNDALASLPWPVDADEGGDPVPTEMPTRRTTRPRHSATLGDTEDREHAENDG